MTADTDYGQTGFPETAQLAASLSRLLQSRGLTAGAVEVVQREPNARSGRLASEVVTCIAATGQPFHLFCKYESPHPHPLLDGPGLLYEAHVHSNVLEVCGARTPACLGLGHDPATGRRWLVTEFLVGGHQASDRRPDRASAMVMSASWIGDFHRLLAGSSELWKGLHVYDREHYLSLARETAAITREVVNDYPWMPRACVAFEGLLDDLLREERTVIHGDYFGDNILARGGRIYPVDWQWTAVAPGEIDIACLTDRWDVEIVAACLDAYSVARWGSDGIPSDFTRSLDIARLYLCFRYMGTTRDFALAESRRWRFLAVRDLSERLGIL